MKLLDTLFLILLVLKLFGLIAISWWFVFMPLIVAFIINIIITAMVKNY